MFVQVGSQSSRHISSSRAISRSEFIYRLVVLGLVTLNVVLVWQGLGSWPELALLTLGLIGLTWVMSRFAPFKPRIVEDNSFTRAGTLARRIAAYGAPMVAAAVVNIPQLTFQQGAGFLTAMLGASTLLLGLGKALNATALLANVAVCAALAVAIYILPEPPGTSPLPNFEHDVQTDVTLKIMHQTLDGNPQRAYDVGYSCFAIMPRTWFTKRPLVLLTIASTAIEAEPVVEIPFSPLGYVIKAHEDGRLGAPGFAEAEVTEVRVRICTIGSPEPDRIAGMAKALAPLSNSVAFQNIKGPNATSIESVDVDFLIVLVRRRPTVESCRLLLRH